MNHEEDKILKRHQKILMISICLIVTLFLSSSYALLANFDQTEDIVTFKTGNLNMTINNTTGLLNLNGKLPQSDENGMMEDPIILNVTNTGTMEIKKYDIKLVKELDKNSTLNESYIKYAVSLDGGVTYTEPSILSSNSNIVYSGYLMKVGESKNIYLKIWLDESSGVDALNKIYYGMVQVDLYQEADIPVKVLIEEKMHAATCNSTITDTDGTIYFSGTNDCVNYNYVWYSGKLWRITAIYPDGKMKLITEDLLTAISWGASPTISSSDLTSAYGTSWLRQWLNQEFLSTLSNHENIVVEDSKWNATTTTSPTEKANETTLITDPVGGLTPYEYYKSYQNATAATGYLNIGYHWWLITPYNTSLVRAVYADGTLIGPDNNLSSSTGGVRATINFMSTVNLAGGDGTINNPYTIKGDIETAVHGVTYLNERVSGEYVKLENDTDTKRVFRIIGTEMIGDKLTTKLLFNDYIKINKSISTTSVYGGGTSDDYWDYYLNNTYLETFNINMLEQGKYYLGYNSGSTSYKATVCSEYSNDVSIKECIANNKTVSKTWTGYVGLPRVGEMFSNRTKDYTYANWFNFFLITPYGGTYTASRWVNNYGYLNSTDPLNKAYARPTIHLKSTIVIKSGTGTEFDPFIVGLPN